MTSVNTHDGERDSTFKGADLFSVKQFPTAQYIAEKFTDNGKGPYVATGKLTIRNVTKHVPLEFTFEQKATGAWLEALRPSSASTSAWGKAIGKTPKRSRRK